MDLTLALEIGAAVLIVLIPILIKLVPSDSPANKWVSLGGTIIMALLRDYSKEKDDDGKKITHDEITFAKKLRSNPKLRLRLGLKRSED